MKHLFRLPLRIIYCIFLSVIWSIIMIVKLLIKLIIFLWHLKDKFKFSLSFDPYEIDEDTPEFLAILGIFGNFHYNYPTYFHAVWNIKKTIKLTKY